MEIRFNYELMYKLLLYLFIPVFVAVVFLWVFLKIYYDKKKGDPTKNYARRGTILSLLLANVVTVVLFTVSLLYSNKFISDLKANNLVDGNEFIYYVVLLLPIIPFVCLCFYFINMLHTMTKKSKNAFNDRISKSDTEDVKKDNAEIKDNKTKTKVKVEKEDKKNDDIEVL